MDAIGVPFDLAIVAGEIGSYKPAPRHWEVFREQTGATPATHVHVAQSLFHDIAPRDELGIRIVWINRLGEPPTTAADEDACLTSSEARGHARRARSRMSLARPPRTRTPRGRAT